MNRIALGLLATGLLTASTAAPAETELDTRDEIRFVVLADTQFGYLSVFERMAHEIELLNPEFVIQVGDLINGYTHNEEQLRREWDIFMDQIEPLSMPFYPVPGNHDVVTPESEKVYAEVWGPDRYHYSFDYGPVHCIVLNSWWQEADERIEDWQYEWLKSNLEAYAEANGGMGSEELAARSIFVFVHSPLWRYAADHPGRQDWNRVHDLLTQYPVKFVAAGHTHEYVWENRDGIDYLVFNSSGGKGIGVERAGFMHNYLHVSVEGGSEVSYAVIKAGSILPLDTVDNKDRRTNPRYALRGSTIRVPDWQDGEPLDTTVSITLRNNIDEDRAYHLRWDRPMGSATTVEPSEMWVELAPGETVEPEFRLTSEAAPPPAKRPSLTVTSEKVLRTGVVPRDWEQTYRERIAAAETDPSIRPTQIDLDAPVTFTGRHTLFAPPVAVAAQKDGAITIDGAIEEAAWDEAEPATDLRSSSGNLMEHQTFVRFLYDDDYLYVGARLEEPNPEGMIANAGGDIPLTWSDDDFELFFDPGNTQSTYWRLFENYAGTRFSSKPRHIENKYFDAAYESAIEIGEDYWSIEMQIPWVDLDVTDAPGPGDRWSINIGRHRQQEGGTRQAWAGGGLYDVSRYGLLAFE